jgi:hypothetical protein
MVRMSVHVLGMVGSMDERRVYKGSGGVQVIVLLLTLSSLKRFCLGSIFTCRIGPFSNIGMAGMVRCEIHV